MPFRIFLLRLDEMVEQNYLVVLHNFTMDLFQNLWFIQHNVVAN
jgi:hypothetical protein